MKKSLLLIMMIGVTVFSWAANLELIDQEQHVKWTYRITETKPRTATIVLLEPYPYDTKEKYTGILGKDENLTVPSEVPTDPNVPDKNCVPVTVFGDESTSRGVLRQQLYFKQLGTVTFPACLKTIGQYAFSKQNLSNQDWKASLTGVRFAEGSQLAKIGERAFSFCTSLQEISIPKTVTDIAPYAFEACKNMHSVVFEEVGTERAEGALTTIKEGAFAGCGLTSVVIPKNVKTLEYRAFSSCHQLTKISFEEGASLETIGEEAFYVCSSKALEVTIPPTVKSIGKNAFNVTTPLVLNADRFPVDKGMSKSSIKKIIIPEGVTEVPDGAFSACAPSENNRTDTIQVELSDSVTKVGKDAFPSTSTNKNYIFNLTLKDPNNPKIPEGLPPDRVIITNGNGVANEDGQFCRLEFYDQEGHPAPDIDPTIPIVGKIKSKVMPAPKGVTTLRVLINVVDWSTKTSPMQQNSLRALNLLDDIATLPEKIVAQVTKKDASVANAGQMLSGYDFGISKMTWEKNEIVLKVGLRSRLGEGAPKAKLLPGTVIRIRCNGKAVEGAETTELDANGEAFFRVPTSVVLFEGGVGTSRLTVHAERGSKDDAAAGSL